ncbi:MAG TPA: lysophospholipase [Pyrinomonadaceae bacterium]|nr:lysophospholipase [Pyrinomonadaceae bacterium]
MNESTFEGVGGLKIATKSWQPEGKPRGVAILIHGFNAHSGYMVWPAEKFAANGLAAYALDLRGRGKSEGERFYVENFSDYLTDVNTLVSQARSENPGLPIYVLGHSAGGVIASSYVFEHQDEIAGLICESFAFDVGLPHLVQLALEGLSHLTPHLHVFSLNNADFSRDPAAVEAMNNDPLIAKESQPAETASEMLKAADRLKEIMPKFTAPVFIIHGTEDKATRPAGSQYFYDNAGSADKTLKLYEGHYHDLLNDIGKEEVIADILSWVDARIPAESSAVSGS